MNKMTKGALATGLGVAMLLGGGGTLAVWNESASASAGTIVAGDLGLKAGTGVWTNTAGKEVTTGYLVVPGDVLTYTQPLAVTLTGDLMEAELTSTGTPVSGFDPATVSTVVTIRDAQGVLVPDSITDSGDYIASTTFTFDEDTTGVSGTGASIDFEGIGYKLTQVAP